MLTAVRQIPAREASFTPLDQFIVQHPDYFFGSSPEHAHVQPDNLEILLNHLKCAAFELPLAPDEPFGNVDLWKLCEKLAEAGFLHRSGGKWHWVQELAADKAERTKQLPLAALYKLCSAVSDISTQP